MTATETAALPVSLPLTLEGWRDRHRGQSIVVCGCGSSLNKLEHPERFLTIGVNDVGRLFQPTYLVVLNPRRQFSGDRFRHVEQSRAKAIFTQLDLGIRHPHIVRFRLGDRGGADPSLNPARLHFTRNSPYVALQLSMLMGASRIGLIGVDFTDHHFFARTGRHSLAGSFSEIDTEYRRVAEVARRRGVEIVNLSAQSRLTAFPKVALADWAGPAAPTAKPAPRVFFVHYQFLSCGDVFRTGLHNAARDLNVESEGAMWDDPQLPVKAARFAPDLLFVVHGRRFAQRWGRRLAQWPSAVWLVDEPYEVDDTERTSRLFDHVFVNDPSTLDRHRNAHYLPVAFEPRLHRDTSVARNHDVGFIGGGNPSRERFLQAFANERCLSYIVGGPWNSPELRRLSLSNNIPPSRTVELYQQTKIVLNVYRDKHHFNRRGTHAYSLNPRVYEALACGALVISEDRPESGKVFPRMPVFRRPEEALEIARSLLASPPQREELLQACQAELPHHTYAARLQTALQSALGFTPSPSEVPTRMTPIQVHETPAYPRFAILMVVHNGLMMVRSSTLKTLRHSRGCNARLTVVDNASTDGSQHWLRMLADRGDIDLIRLDQNIGHGPALEKARAATQSGYVVTLDSDAFPLADGWLETLADKLDGSVQAAGIGHHRGYVHPSCLMIRRDALEGLGSTFLNEKNKPSRFDVAERLSHDILAGGGRLALLDRTASHSRGSQSEPVYLGAEYEGIVFHQWYTTRHSLARQVDDVPREAFDQALRDTLRKLDAEPREHTVVVGLRAQPDQPERLRNARATLESLNRQDLERWRYRIVVVEQDREPRLEGDLGALVDRWLFAPNAGAYNRSWGFNAGALNPEAASGTLFLTDADLLFPADFLRVGLETVTGSAKATLPYSSVRYLSPSSTERVVRDPAAADLEGHVFTNSQGGCLFIDTRTFLDIGGYDERFEGWGREDREFWLRLSRHCEIAQLDRTILHLHHQRPAESGPEAERNRVLFEQIRRQKPRPAETGIGKLDRYAAFRPPATARDWQNWETWTDAKIERIVQQELASISGTRPLLASLLDQLASRVLDIGCGPGAVNARLRAQSASTVWTGVDVTKRMLRTARKLFPDAPLVNADAAALPFPDRAFEAVLLRHVLEHLPEDLMQSTLTEALRVAGKLALVDFYVRPSSTRRTTQRVGEHFLETRWTAADIEQVVTRQGWIVARRHVTGPDAELWILAPSGASDFLENLNEEFAAQPKISIVMPTYRRPHTLPRTLRSVLAQTYSNWELIVVDNAGNAVLPFDDPRIRLIRDNQRASAAYARNAGVRHATGDLICYFDDDDVMYPGYLEAFATAFRKHPRASMVRCGMIVTGNRVNYSYATPECCLRRDFATPTWDDRGPCQDQRYFKRIVKEHAWSEENGDIVTLRQPLCRATHDPRGGLRSGRH